MTIEKTIFNVIVPLEFDMNDFKKLTKGEGLEEFRKVFDSEPLRDTEHPVKTESLKGESPILKNEENAYMMRFKIAVNQRTAIGLSCEEDCIYTHKASKIRFRISNVRLWFTRWGIAFLTLEISGENLTNDEILDLNAILSTILQLRYAKDAVCWNDNEGHTIEGEFTFYNMIRSFTNLQRDIPLESRYKDKTHCLFYGVADEIKDDSDTKKGMETLCRQLKSGLRTPKEVATLYYPFDKQHICWIFSENVLAGIGDIKKCKNENDKATEENDKNFLREILQESIQDNYLPLYLYYLSLRFLVGLLMEKCESAEVRKHSGEREEVKQQLGLLQELVENDDNPKNRKLRELALYDFINDIFDYYLCEKTWGYLSH